MSLRLKRNDITVLAGEDLSSYRGCAVQWSGTDNTKVVHWASGAVLGILQNAPQSGEPAEVAMAGGGAYAKMSTSNSTLGLYFAADTGGVLTATTSAAAEVIAKNMEINTQANSLVEVELVKLFYHA